jgi:Domain of unknown function (DUF1931)
MAASRGRAIQHFRIHSGEHQWRSRTINTQDRRAALPPLDLACSVETEARLPEIAGALSLALARTFKIIDPDFKNPQSERWERSFRIFDLLL